MLDEVKLLCNLIESKRINQEKLLKKLNTSHFSLIEQEKIIESLLTHYANLDNEILNSFNSKVLENIVIKFLVKNELMYVCQLVHYANPRFLDEIINKVIKTNNIDYFIILANNLPKEKIRLLEDVIIKSKNVMYMYDFLLQVKNSNKAKFEDAIIKSGDINYIFFISRDVEGINILKMRDAIISLKKAECAYRFAEYFSKKIPGFSILELENCVIQYGNPREVVLFAQEVKGANISRLVNKILECNDLEWIIYSCNIEGVDFNLLENKVIESKDPYYIYKLACSFKSKNITTKKLEQALLDLVNNYKDKKNLSKYIYLYANNFQDYDIDIEKIQNILIKLNDFENIYKFYKTVKSSNHEKIFEKILEDKSEMELNVLDYRERNNKKLTLSDWKKFIFTHLGIVISNESDAVNLIAENLISLIEKYGLVYLYLKLNSDYFNFKRITYEVLQGIYPNSELELQVYYDFLTTNMRIEEAVHLDLEYKSLQENKKVKQLIK